MSHSEVSSLRQRKLETSWYFVIACMKYGSERLGSKGVSNDS